MRRFAAVFLFLLLASCARPGVKTMERKGDFYTVKLEYPVLENVPAGLNKTIAEAALIHLEQVEDDPVSFDEYVKNFADDNAAARKEFPNSQWAAEAVLSVARRGPATLTTVCRSYSNTGGAHPNTFVHYENYDLRDGRRLELSDLLEPGQLDALKTAAGLQSRDFPNEPEIGLLREHLAYVSDSDSRMNPEVPIPYSKLKGILKPQYFP